MSIDADAIRAAEIKAGLDWNLENAHPLLMAIGPLRRAYEREKKRADEAETRIERVRVVRSCLGAADMDYEAFTDEVDAILAGADADNAWDGSVPPGGFVCSMCGTPTESEPCREHQPAATRAMDEEATP